MIDAFGAVLIVLAGIAAGAINAIVGSGSLVTFPTLLLLAAIPDHAVGVAALLLFALFTAVSMALASTTFGLALSRGPVRRRFSALAPVLGMASLVFGAWYAFAAVGTVPYAF